MSLNAGMDRSGELDEIFLDADFVHIERMANRSFWIGVTLKNGETIHIRSGICEQKWYFLVEETCLEGERHVVKKPACYAKHKPSR